MDQPTDKLREWIEERMGLGRLAEPAAPAEAEFQRTTEMLLAIHSASVDPATEPALTFELSKLRELA